MTAIARALLGGALAFGLVALATAIQRPHAGAFERGETVRASLVRRECDLRVVLDDGTMVGATLKVCPGALTTEGRP